MTVLCRGCFLFLPLTFFATLARCGVISLQVAFSPVKIVKTTADLANSVNFPLTATKFRYLKKKKTCSEKRAGRLQKTNQNACYVQLMQSVTTCSTLHRLCIHAGVLFLFFWLLFSFFFSKSGDAASVFMLCAIRLSSDICLPGQALCHYSM